MKLIEEERSTYYEITQRAIKANTSEIEKLKAENRQLKESFDIARVRISKFFSLINVISKQKRREAFLKSILCIFFYVSEGKCKPSRNIRNFSIFY